MMSNLSFHFQKTKILKPKLKDLREVKLVCLILFLPIKSIDAREIARSKSVCVPGLKDRTPVSRERSKERHREKKLDQRSKTSWYARVPLIPVLITPQGCQLMIPPRNQESTLTWWWWNLNSRRVPRAKQQSGTLSLH